MVLGKSTELIIQLMLKNTSLVKRKEMLVGKLRQQLYFTFEITSP